MKLGGSEMFTHSNTLYLVRMQLIYELLKTNETVIRLSIDTLRKTYKIVSYKNLSEKFNFMILIIIVFEIYCLIINYDILISISKSKNIFTTKIIVNLNTIY